jgi:hypothetical protein
VIVYLTAIGFYPGSSSGRIGHNKQVTHITRIQNTFKQNTTIKDTTDVNTEKIQTTTTVQQQKE